MGPMNELVAKYSDKVDFMYIYIIDPHPKTDPSPYRASTWTFNYSLYRQPTTYDERVQEAKILRSTYPLDEKVTVVVDDLRPHNSTMQGDNPVWCRWGPAPNPGWLMLPNGTVAFAQAWFNASDVDTVLQGIIGQEPSQPASSIQV